MSDPADSDSAPAPPPETEPVFGDPVRLSALSDAFGQQAETLRRAAKRNIRAIVGTVILMTIGILALPPLINVVEDKILDAFGYQTSQIDTEEETNTQAVEVQVRNQNLTEILRDRDNLLRQMPAILAQPHHLFVADPLTLLPNTSEVTINDVTSARGVEVIVGSQLSPVGDTELREKPFVALRDRDGDWVRLLGNESGIFGSVHSVRATDTGFILAGRLEDRAQIWRISPENELTYAWIDAPQYRAARLAVDVLERQVTRHLFIGLAYEDIESPEQPDGRLLSVRPWAPTDTPSLSPVLQRGEIKDIDWSGARPTALVQFPTRVEAVSATGNSSYQGRSLDVNGAGLGFVKDTDGRLYAAYVSATNHLVFQPQIEGGEWGPIENAIELPPRGSLYENRDLTDLGDGTAALGRLAPGEVWIVNPRLAAVVSRIRLVDPRIASNDTNTTHIAFTGADGALAFVADQTTFGSNLAIAGPFRQLHVFRDTPLLEGPITTSDDPALLDLIGARQAVLDTRPRGMDTSAGQAGVDVTGSYLSDQFRTLFPTLYGQTRIRTNRDLAGAYGVLRDLENRWSTEWTARETAAQTLARLRQAEEAGDIWRQVSSISARLAVIALLVYLVNILVNLYRYNMRLAAFYQARANAIDIVIASKQPLGDGAAGILAELARANTPEEVTFGARPVPPTDAIAKALPEILKNTRPGG